MHFALSFGYKKQKLKITPFMELEGGAGEGHKVTMTEHLKFFFYLVFLTLYSLLVTVFYLSFRKGGFKPQNFVLKKYAIYYLSFDTKLA